MNDAEAEKLVDRVDAGVLPHRHDPLARDGLADGADGAGYRLAVDESAYVKEIRENVITLITPVVEVDGRDRMVDIYRWHLANPGKHWPNLIYWGKYVAHDNNRDAMALTLNADA